MATVVPAATLWRIRRSRHTPSSRGRRSPRERNKTPIGGIYVVPVPASPEVRRDAFAQFVNRALARAKAAHGWSIPRVAHESGVGTNTLYRWLKGEWSDYPRGELVEAFCDALDIPPSAAFSILWPGKKGQPTVPAPMPADPDFDELARKLMDPNVPEAEKYHIRETVRSLAIRPNRPRKAS